MSGALTWGLSMCYLGAAVGVAGQLNLPTDIYKTFGRKACRTKSGAYRVSPDAGEMLPCWQRLLQCQALLEQLPCVLKKLCLTWLAPSHSQEALRAASFSKAAALPIIFFSLTSKT